ncbi:MAG: lysozyme [Burkholderiales bacterium]|nr:lysozyme [Burkholderiales bacterium]
MELSEKGIEFLKSIETFRPKPYDDQTGKEITEWCKGATIGYGHLIGKAVWLRISVVKLGKLILEGGISEEQGALLLRYDLERFEAAVLSKVDRDHINQNEFDALVILCYNIGTYAFTTSSLARMLKGEKTGYRTIEAAWKAWEKSQGRVMQGLINRRNAEWRIYSEGVYERW